MFQMDQIFYFVNNQNNHGMPQMKRYENIREHYCDIMKSEVLKNVVFQNKKPVIYKNFKFFVFQKGGTLFCPY